MRIGLEIEVSDKELLGRLANVKEKKEALDRAMAQLESCITSRYEASWVQHSPSGKSRLMELTR